MRAAIDKKLKSIENAREFLGALEDSCRDRLLAGQDCMYMADCIEKIELARKDICDGMDYSKALKRLFLES